jgi:hypothetical protein
LSSAPKLGAVHLGRRRHKDRDARDRPIELADVQRQPAFGVHPLGRVGVMASALWQLERRRTERCKDRRRVGHARGHDPDQAWSILGIEPGHRGVRLSWDLVAPKPRWTMGQSTVPGLPAAIPGATEFICRASRESVPRGEFHRGQPGERVGARVLSRGGHDVLCRLACDEQKCEERGDAVHGQ